MPSISAPLRLATFLALHVTFGVTVFSSDASSPGFPPLNKPALDEHRPGKFVWADLFTTDPVAATHFYCGLFGWSAQTGTQNNRTYTVFSNGGRPVAGLAPRPAANAKRPARWIGYIAVTDIATTLEQVKKSSGLVRAPAREVSARGTQAIIADNEGATVGLLQSTSGDSVDTEPLPGEWNWFQLYVSNPRAAAGYYHEIFGYEVALDLRTERREDFILSSAGRARAGVAPLPVRDHAQSGWLGVIRVKHLDESLLRAVALGGEVLLPPRPVAYDSRFAIIADSTGGSIGLVEYADDADPANRP